MPSGTSLRGLKVRVLPLRSAGHQRAPARRKRDAALQIEERRHGKSSGGKCGGEEFLVEEVGGLAGTVGVYDGGGSDGEGA